MKNTLIGWLAAKGIVLANESSEENVLHAVQKAFTDATAPVTGLANEKETLSGQLTTLGNEKTSLTAQVTALTNERDTARTAVKTERTLAAAATVDLAITRGKLKLAGRAAQITALENSADFAKDAGALLGAANVVTTIGGAKIGADGKVLANDMDSGSARSTYCAAIEKHMKDTGESDPIKAHRAVMDSMPALAEALKPKGA